MKLLAKIQLAIIAGVAGYCTINQNFIEAKSFLYGAIFGIINLGILFFSLEKLFKKKSPFFPAMLLVGKYSMFGVALFFLIRHTTISLPWLVFGLSVPVPSIILYGFVNIKGHRFKDNKLNGSL